MTGISQGTIYNCAARLGIDLKKAEYGAWRGRHARQDKTPDQTP
jgi:hypothetical protein